MPTRKVGPNPAAETAYDPQVQVDPVTGEQLEIVTLKTAGSRKYDRASGQKITIDSSNHSSTAIASDEVTIFPTIDCLIKIANPAPTASASAGASIVAALTPWTERITSGDIVSVIALDAAESGYLLILPRDTTT